MFDDFHAVLLEGIFYKDLRGNLAIQTPDGETLVSSVLQPLLGKQVQLAVHHVPPMPPDPGRWGGGCCLWQPSRCPAGHHEQSGWLYNVSGQGFLSEAGDDWTLEGFDGSTQLLRLNLFLPGHHARVAAATLFSVEGMRENLARSGGLDLVDTLGTKASNLRDLLERLQNPMGDKQ